MIRQGLGALAMLAPLGGACATSYNVSTEFSISTNTQTSLWSYRFNTTGVHDNNYSLMATSGNIRNELGAFLANANGPSTTPTLGDASFPCWFTPAGAGLTPLFCNNATSNNAIASFRKGASTIFTARITPAGTVQFSPPPAGLSVVSFLVPAAGMATILYQFTPNDYSCSLPGSDVTADGITWSVDKNAETVTYGTLYTTSAMSLATTGSDNVSFPVNRGDRINFIIAPNKGNANCTSTVLNATISIP
jgi:hypothetical protein